MASPSICFGYETALQILRTTGPRERTLLRSGAHTMPDRAPSMCAFRQALESLETLHPSMMLEQPAHLLVSRVSQCRSTSAFTVRVCKTTLHGHPFHRLGNGAYVSSAPLAFVHIAAQEDSMIALLELGYELCGSYQTKRTGTSSAYQVEPLSSVLLGLPMMYGGYGLGIPRMNYEVKANPAAQALTGKSCFRCDLCWPEAKLDVEYQSRESHSGEEKRIEDSRRTNALASMGWTVVSVTNDELDSLVATDAIADRIRKHLGKRSQVRVANYHSRKLKLRRQLGLPIGYD